MRKLPLLISIPHAGLRVPDEVADCCVLTPAQIAADGDGEARQIYDLDNDCASVVSTDIARAIVDMNRAEDDRRPDGVVKTHTCWDVPVYSTFPSGETVEALMERYHRPYHHRLRECADGAVRLGVDCHTMAAVAPTHAPDPGAPRPALCLSNADGTLPASWFRQLADCLERAFNVPPSLNTPFRGGYIIRTHAADLPWVQLEISREESQGADEKREKLIRALHEFCTFL